MMIRIDNKRGTALIAVLIFSIIGLAIIGAMVQMVIQGTKLSGIGKRYATALEAAKGGADIITDMIDYYPKNPDFGTKSSDCWDDKVTNETNSWSTCSNSIYKSVNAKEKSDVVVDLGDYNTYLKIVDTRDSLQNGTTYTFYTIELLSEHISNPQEKARVSFLYRVGL